MRTALRLDQFVEPAARVSEVGAGSIERLRAGGVVALGAAQRVLGESELLIGHRARFGRERAQFGCECGAARGGVQRVRGAAHLLFGRVQPCGLIDREGEPARGRAAQRRGFVRGFPHVARRRTRELVVQPVRATANDVLLIEGRCGRGQPQFAPLRGRVDRDLRVRLVGVHAPVVALRCGKRSTSPSCSLPVGSKSMCPVARVVPLPVSSIGTVTPFDSSGPTTYTSAASVTLMSSRATNAMCTRAPGRTVRGRGVTPDTCSNHGGSSRAARTRIAVSVRSRLRSTSRTRTSFRTPLSRNGNTAVALHLSAVSSAAISSDFGASWERHSKWTLRRRVRELQVEVDRAEREAVEVGEGGERLFLQGGGVPGWNDFDARAGREFHRVERGDVEPVAVCGADFDAVLEIGDRARPLDVERAPVGGHRLAHLRRTRSVAEYDDRFGRCARAGALGVGG